MIPRTCETCEMWTPDCGPRCGWHSSVCLDLPGRPWHIPSRAALEARVKELETRVDVAETSAQIPYLDRTMKGRKYRERIAELEAERDSAIARAEAAEQDAAAWRQAAEVAQRNDGAKTIEGLRGMLAVAEKERDSSIARAESEWARCRELERERDELRAGKLKP